MKRLYKSEHDKKLDGVCGGIAEYLNIDSTTVRAIWALGTLFTVGVGIFGYLACAIIIPKESEIV